MPEPRRRLVGVTPKLAKTCCRRQKTPATPKTKTTESNNDHRSTFQQNKHQQRRLFFFSFFWWPLHHTGHLTPTATNYAGPHRTRRLTHPKAVNDQHTKKPWLIDYNLKKKPPKASFVALPKLALSPHQQCSHQNNTHKKTEQIERKTTTTNYEPRIQILRL